MEYIKKKDVFRRGSSLKIYTSAAVSKKCFKHRSTLNDTHDQEAVVNQDDVARDNDDNNEEEREISRRSTRHKKAPRRNDFIARN